MSVTTLEDLKRAIELVEQYKSLSLDQRLTGALWGASRERDAWRLAFEWRDQIPAGGSTDEYLEGMRLIREKLK